MQQVSRRHFILSSAAIGASAGIGLAAPGVYASTESLSKYPIPTAAPARFIEFSSTIVPDSDSAQWQFSWEIAEDPYFENVVNRDGVMYSNNGEDLLSVRLENVPTGRKLYYRTFCENCYSQEQEIELSQLKAKQFVVFPTRQIAESSGADTVAATVEQTF